MSTSSDSSTLVPVSDDPALSAHRVAVSQGSRVAGPAVLTVDGRRGPMSVPVRAEPNSTVPDRFVLVADDLAASLGFTAGARWNLAASRSAPLSSVTIEALVEDPPDKIWDSVRNDEELVGRYLPTGADASATVVEAGEYQFRVRALSSTVDAPLGEITAATEVELFVPAALAGLDIVVLADCSGSMGVDDLPMVEAVGVGRQGHRARIDALKDSLLQMLHARLRVSGRESRLALVRFNEATQQRFPRSGGMVAVGSSSPGNVVDEFRHAIEMLELGGGTDIPGALLAAAELLERHGKPDNDRLIVLVSDGRTWTPKGAEETGELVWAGDDPVSLVDHLHRFRRIRLHAIGISNRELYMAWLRRTGHPDNAGLSPDHPLIERLVEVGGGDPTRIGGIDVLEGYFGGLGAGLTRRVGRLKEAARPNQLRKATVAQIREEDGAPVRERLRSAVEEWRQTTLELNEVARSLAGRSLGPWIPFDQTDLAATIFQQSQLLKDIHDRLDFEPVLLRVHLLLVERGPGRRKAEGRDWPDVLKPVFECFREVVGRVNALRQPIAHDKSGNTGRDQRDVEMAAKARLHYVSTRHIDDGAGATWSALRVAVLEDCATTTRQALDLALKLAAAPSKADSAPDEPIQIDLRVRN